MNCEKSENAIKIVSICATERKKGNSVLAAKYIAKKLNAELEVINLVKLNIRPCKACYKCLYGEECRIDDDVVAVFERINEADLVLICSPVYWLDATGMFKALLDRCFMAISYIESFSQKNAIILTFHGFEDMKGWASATHNVFARVLGLNVLANIEVRAALPGEIFLEKENIEKLNLAADLLIKGERSLSENQCPVCMNTTFRIENGKLVCPVCGSVFDAKLNLIEKGERFTLEWIAHHFGKELIGLKEKYKVQKEELKKAIKIVE
jgi:NAD(P)H-dependent FMN reductase